MSLQARFSDGDSFVHAACSSVLFASTHLCVTISIPSA